MNELWHIWMSHEANDSWLTSWRDSQDAKHCKTTRCNTLQHQGLMTHTLTWLTCNTLQHQWLMTHTLTWLTCNTLQHQGLMTHTLTWLTWLAKCNTLQHTATPMTHDSYIDMTRLIRWHDSQQACRKVKCSQEPHTYAAKRTERTANCLQTCLFCERERKREREKERKRERERERMCVQVSNFQPSWRCPVYTIRIETFHRKVFFCYSTRIMRHVILTIDVSGKWVISCKQHVHV